MGAVNAVSASLLSHGHDGRVPAANRDAKLNQPDNQNIRALFADFLAAIRSRRRPVCDIETGHRLALAA